MLQVLEKLDEEAEELAEAIKADEQPHFPVNMVTCFLR